MIRSAGATELVDSIPGNLGKIAVNIGRHQTTSDPYQGQMLKHFRIGTSGRTAAQQVIHYNETFRDAA